MHHHKKKKEHLHHVKKQDRILGFLLLDRIHSFSFLRKYFLSVAFVLIVFFLALSTSFQNLLQANIVESPEVPGDPSSSALEFSGMIITHEKVFENNERLKNLFSSFFPNLAVQMVPAESSLGQEWIRKFSIKELPTIVYKKVDLESEESFQNLRDVFVLQGDFFILKGELVNPSYQLRFGSPPSLSGTTPLQGFVYTDLRCATCLLSQQAFEKVWSQWVSTGLIELQYFQDRKTIEDFGISESPTILIGRRGTLEWIRMAGVHEEKEYQEIMERLMSG